MSKKKKTLKEGTVVLNTKALWVMTRATPDLDSDSDSGLSWELVLDSDKSRTFGSVALNYYMSACIMNFGYLASVYVGDDWDQLGEFDTLSEAQLAVVNWHNGVAPEYNE